MEKLTIEQRKEKLLKKIEELGILDMHFEGGNVDNLTAYEQIVEVVDQHNKEYPPEYVAAKQEFIEAVREDVWVKDKPFHGFYFRISDIIFWGLKDYGLEPEKSRDFCEKILDIEKLYSIFKDITEAKNEY
jgi:hypothetical protein